MTKQYVVSISFGIRSCFCLSLSVHDKNLSLNGYSDRFSLFRPGIKNVAFFFSAISAQGRKNSKGKNTTSKDDEDSDENVDEVLTPSQAASSATQEWISNHPTVINDKLRLSVEYWIALTTPHGAPANPITIHRALLDCDVDTTAKQVH